MWGNDARVPLCIVEWVLRDDSMGEQAPMGQWRHRNAQVQGPNGGCGSHGNQLPSQMLYRDFGQYLMHYY